MKPLSRKFRRTLFWTLFAIFVLAAPVLILYSQGYRLGDALSLVETGGIYIHSDLASTRVYLDGEFVENTGLILRNTLIQDLTPHTQYEVWVEKEGYQSWVKRLQVQPNLVTEARVFMLPSALQWQTVAATTSVLAVPDDASAATSSVATTTVVANPLHVELQELFEEDREQFEVEIATTTFVYVGAQRVATTTTETELQFPEWLRPVASTSALHEKEMIRERDGVVAWLDEGDLHAQWGRVDEAPPYFFCNTTATCTAEFIIDWQEPIERYEFYPSRSDVVILSTARGIFAVELDDRSQRNIQIILEEQGLSFRIDENDTLIVFDGERFRRSSW